MPGYDGPSIFNKRLSQFSKQDDKKKAEQTKPTETDQQRSQPKARSSHRASISERAQKRTRTGKDPAFDFTRSSTPFQVRKVPSPYYGLHPRPPKKEDTVDYSAVKRRMKKANEDVILFDGYVKEEFLETVDYPAVPKKRSGLSKSLSGIIEEEHHVILSKNHRMTNLFSSHILD